MKEEMVNRLTITLAHVTPIHIITGLFSPLKLPIVRLFLKAVVQTKKATLEGTFCFHMLFQGKN